MTTQKDYKRMIAEDLAEFTQSVLEPEFLQISREGSIPVVLGIKYPVHGSAYAATLNARLNAMGRTNYLYKEVRLQNSHMEGYTKDEIENRRVLVIGMVLSNDIVPYLRELREEGASDIFYAFRIPHPGGILELKEMERVFSG